MNTAARLALQRQQAGDTADRPLTVDEMLEIARAGFDD